MELTEPLNCTINVRKRPLDSEEEELEHPEEFQHHSQVQKVKHTIISTQLCGCFYQSSCHRAFAEDALNTKVINVRPGGVQPRMRDMMQKMIFDDGTPKGMKQVSEESSINTTCTVAEDMRTVLSWHDDF